MKSKHYEKYNVIGKNIKTFRKQKNLTQSDLAELLGISKSYLSKIEAPNCDKTFSLDLLFDLAVILKVPINRLLEGV